MAAVCARGQLPEVALLDQFIFIGIFVVVALIFGVTLLALAFFLRRKKAHPSEKVYERGLETRDEAPVGFKIQHYILALTFVVFDVAAAFLLALAPAYHALGLYAVIEIIAFILILLGGLVYVWRKGALEWI